jgi:ketosteroid isomerase-like protein
MQPLARILIAFTIGVWAAGPIAASEKTDVMNVLHQFIDSFNKGDIKASLATCADQTSIIDDIPPHEWHGAGACAKWMDALVADSKKNEITDEVVTLHKARHVNVTGDRAYVVVPTDYVYKMKGTEVKELGSTITVALQKGQTGWRITGWAWAMR